MIHAHGERAHAQPFQQTRQTRFNAVDIEGAFNSAMAEKISSRLETMRAEVAQNMFKTPEAVVEEGKTTTDVEETGLSEEELEEAKKKKMEKC